MQDQADAMTELRRGSHDRDAQTTSGHGIASQKGIAETGLPDTETEGLGTAPASTSGTGTLGKAMEVVEIVANHRGPIRFTDILAKSSQPRGTLHRQLSNLVEEGLLSANPDHSYELGLKLLKLASTAWAGNEFRRIAEPHIRHLQRQTGETVHLGVLKGQQVIYLDKMEGDQSVRMHSQIGNASPVYCTGVGKAALSVFPDEEASRLLEDIAFKRFTEATLPSLEALIRELDEIRKHGVAWDREEHETGIHCVAAPVYSAGKNIAAGLSVTAPVYRVSREQLAEWVPLVRKAALDLTEELSIRLSPRS